MSAPNPDDFSKVEYPNKYTVIVEVKTEIILEVTAPSEEAARDVGYNKVVSDDCFFEETEAVKETVVKQVDARPPMYRVLRGDKKYQVTRLEAGDLPREPDVEGGF